MPIGVPKVPFRLPGEPSAQWVDLYNRLYRERVLFLCQALDDELANQLIGIMLYLNAEEKSKGLYIYINSPGGSVTCGIAVYDTMNYVKADVTTICVGTAASMASFVLAGGDRGKRSQAHRTVDRGEPVNLPAPPQPQGAGRPRQAVRSNHPRHHRVQPPAPL